MNLLEAIKKAVVQEERIDKTKAYKKERIEKLVSKNMFIDEATPKQKISYVNR